MNIYEELINSIEIEKGSIIDVVSDMRLLMLKAREKGVRFKGEDFIEALKEAVGSEGTLMLRMFNWDFCKGIPFDAATTKSHVGALGNYALKMPEFRRTRHPIYSWMVWGKYADELCEIDDDNAFGASSIFAWQYNHDNAYIIRFTDTEYDGRTYFHYVEDKLKVPYRYPKNFTADYKDADGNVSQKTYSMLVHDMQDTRGSHPRVLNDIFAKEGAFVKGFYEDVAVEKDFIKLQCDIMERDLIDNFPGSTYDTPYPDSFYLKLTDEVNEIIKAAFTSLNTDEHRFVTEKKADANDLAQALENAFGIKINTRKTEYFDSVMGMACLVGWIKNGRNDL